MFIFFGSNKKEISFLPCELYNVKAVEYCCIFYAKFADMRLLGPAANDLTTNDLLF